MQNKLLPVLLAAAAFACGARAQDSNVATPTNPAPVVQQAAPAQNAQPAAAPAALPAPNQIIYAPRLPNPAELTNAASAQGLTVDQISQTSSQVTVVYRNSSGQTNTVAYQLLPTGAPATTTTVVQQPAPTVIYQQPAPTTVYYYDSYPDYYYYPRYYRPPVSLSLGFGYYHGWGGGWHGGGHHWH